MSYFLLNVFFLLQPVTLYDKIIEMTINKYHINVKIQLKFKGIIDKYNAKR